MDASPSDREKDEAARLFESAYEELCRIARGNRFVGLRADAIQAQALVHETFIRLRDHFLELPPDRRGEPRDYLLKVALAMRTVARSRWRRSRAAKRGGSSLRVELDESRVASSQLRGLSPGEVLALYEAMDGLQRHHEGWFDVIRYRYFEGCTVRETAERMGIDAARVKRRRRQALAWLRRTMRNRVPPAQDLRGTD